MGAAVGAVGAFVGAAVGQFAPACAGVDIRSMHIDDVMETHPMSSHGNVEDVTAHPEATVPPDNRQFKFPLGVPPLSFHTQPYRLTGVAVGRIVGAVVGSTKCHCEAAVES